MRFDNLYPMSWYDLFAHFYDGATERIYRPYRERIAAELKLPPTAVVVDLACGTGQNLAYLARRVARGGRVIGLDASEGMLAKAAARVARDGLEGVRLLRADARDFELDAPVDAIVCTLGFSVLPDWEAVMASAWRQLAPGGRLIVFDVYAERRVMQTWWTELIAGADLNRRVWEPLEACAEEFSIEFLDGSPHLLGGRPYLVVAIKAGLD